MPRLFRKEALEELRDPRGLDASIRLVGPRQWLAVSAFGILGLAALLWAIFGRLDYRVDGLAVLLHQGSRVYVLSAPAEGRIVSLYVGKGAKVAKDGLLAGLSLPVLEAEIASLEGEVASLESELKRREGEIARQEADDARSLAGALKAHRVLLKAAREREAFLAKRLAALKVALKKGFAARDTVQATRQEWLAAHQQLLAIPAQIAGLRSDHAARQAARRASIDTLKQSLITARGKLAALAARHDEESRVTAPAAGTIVAVDEPAGRRVAAGDPLFTLETTGGRLTAYAFFPTASGKKIAVGMRAFIGPGDVEREIYGVIRGRVTKISALPRDRADLLARFGNETLVEQILAGGAPIEAEIALDPATAGSSNFSWTASKGPPLELTPGTLASSEVIVRRVHPFTLLIPFLRSLFPFTEKAEGAHAGIGLSR